ncbi:hypothetical protein, partial [Endozoicomonas sp. ONNA1]|uniref:hypothetical protein n=3 Tax=unclassified Endozoicomonas TaxID=2644528 RepID=UPI00214798A1
MVRSLLLLVTIMYGESLPALGLVGSSPVPAHFLSTNMLAEPEQPNSLSVEFMQFALSLFQLLPNKSPLAPLPLPPLPIWPIKQKHRIDLKAVLHEYPENHCKALIALGAAGEVDDDEPPDGNNRTPDPEPQPDLNLVPDPVQKCLQQKKQLLRILRIKRLWSIIKGQTILARIMSDRIMVIEADLLDLESSDPATMHPVLIQALLAQNDHELSVYREIVSGKYSGRQADNGEKGQPSRQANASMTATTGQTGQSGQMSGTAAHNQETGSTGGSGDGGDDPLKPSAEQDQENSVVTCSRCNNALNTQELRRIAGDAAASVFLCDKCLSDTHDNKGAGRTPEETEPDSSEPVQIEKNGLDKKRNTLKVVASGAPADKLRKRAKTQVTDNPLEKVKENIHYELTEQELEKAKTLMKVFEKKNITVKHSFYRLLSHVERRSFNGFFRNAIVFFEHLHETVESTSILTNMLENREEHILDFAQRSQDELEYLATLAVFSSFASMNNGKSLPKHEEVKAVLGWREWKDKDGKFNMNLFLALSSMNRGRGMLKHNEVIEILSWPEWRGIDGKFSIELFLAFSSMNHGRGMPKHNEVIEILSWPEWRGKDGKFNRKLFSALSSMNHGKGMPKQSEVIKVLSWPEWKDKYGEFNMELLHSFSLMYYTRRMPKYEEVKEVLNWSEWREKNGEFSMECFRAFSSMNNGQGVLKYKAVKQVMDWTSCWTAPNHLLLQIMARLWASEGLPAIEELQYRETQLKKSLFREFTSEDSDSDNERAEEDDKFNHQIKTVALYLATPKPGWSLNWSVLKQFLEIHENTETVLMLESLIKLLSSYGGKGVERYLQTSEKDRIFFWHHADKTVPLPVLNKATALFSSDEDRERFVYFAKRLKSLSDESLWEQYTVRLQPLSGVLRLDYMQRLYLEILQPLT